MNNKTLLASVLEWARPELKKVITQSYMPLISPESISTLLEQILSGAPTDIVVNKDDVRKRLHIAHKKMADFVMEKNIYGWWKLVDIGAGRGFFGMQIAKKVKEGHVTCTDIDESYFEVQDPQVVFSKQMTETDIQCDDSSQDVATLIDVVHHMTRVNIEKLLADTKRILKNWGKLLVVENSSDEEKQGTEWFHKLLPQERIKAYAFTEIISHRFLAPSAMDLQLNILSLQEWKRLLTWCGFSVIEYGELPFRPHKLHNLPKWYLIAKK